MQEGNIEFIKQMIELKKECTTHIAKWAQKDYIFAYDDILEIEIIKIRWIILTTLGLWKLKEYAREIIFINDFKK